MKEGMAMDMPMRPHFGISIEHLPEAKEWKIGKTYKVTLKIKQTGISMHKGSDGKEMGHADFEVMGIEPHGEMKEHAMRYTEK